MNKWIEMQKKDRKGKTTCSLLLGKDGIDAGEGKRCHPSKDLSMTGIATRLSIIVQEYHLQAQSSIN